ncbi:glucose-1-phosphate thymidylyltransferase [Streptomyces sp. HD]|uniref:glucose-1-phosphate thymidylyltransferase n=1 Tax=Streptomyces sp. HD TaxID=3020892 RepID=UPI00232F395D|nr:glucose-1-phosphate thymidylyltransferase [Streptomyces sp. HD]MDC0773870.1 glucose-1-phosphate thymidylyltransferase [Streptomyces sp. HD]
MKALVLSGGAGTRLRPITHTSAKQLVPVANKPILFYGLEAIADAGITDVAIVVGDTENEIRQAVGDGSGFGLDVTYLRQEAPLGLAHAVLIARDFLGDDDFVMFLGDIFVFGGISDSVDEFRKERPDAQLLLTRVANPSVFGIAELDDMGRLLRLEEKPEQPRSDLAMAGVYLFSPAIHEAVRAIGPSPRGELEITDALQWLLERDRDVRTTVITGYWKDTGNAADILDVNRRVLDLIEYRVDGDVDENSEIVGRVHIDAGAVIRGSRIVGPAIIGPGTLVEDSYIGPSTSIAQDCVIRNSEIEFSIILRESAFHGVRRVERSLVGRNVRVSVGPRVPVAHRLVIGDHGRVEFSS